MLFSNLLPGRGRRTNRRTRHSDTPARRSLSPRSLRCETLEDRRLLSVADFELSSLLPSNGASLGGRGSLLIETAPNVSYAEVQTSLSGLPGPNPHPAHPPSVPRDAATDYPGVAGEIGNRCGRRAECGLFGAKSRVSSRTS